MNQIKSFAPNCNTLEEHTANFLSVCTQETGIVYEPTGTYLEYSDYFNKFVYVVTYLPWMNLVQTQFIYSVGPFYLST